MIPSSIKQTSLIFWHFFKRDWYVHAKKLPGMLLNYSLLYPAMYAICFAYLQARIYFGNDVKQGTILFAGNILVVILLLSYKLTIDLLFDLQNNRFIDYQITILHPRLVILERILFASIFTFIMMVPFYPVSKLLLQHNLDTSHTSWPHVMLILYVGSLCCSAYHQYATLVLKYGNQITSLWARVNNTLIIFGGFWIPLHVMQKYSPLFARFILLNPALYITEGLRQAIIGGPEFLPFWRCIGMLLIFSVAFTLLSWYQFKKRVDHV